MAWKIGFTGTHLGMSERQKGRLVWILAKTIPAPLEFHHGDCIGADAEAHGIVREHLPETIIIIHPPTIGKSRAFLKGDEMRPKEPYLTRNHLIVEETDVLIAAPATNEEQLRSGTWATVRYARRVRHPVIILDR